MNKSMFVSFTAITAALYIALGYIFQPISFLGVQFRVAEVIVGMCVLYSYPGLVGNIIGVFVVNLSSPLGLLDLISCVVNIPALMAIILLKKNAKYLGGIIYSFIIALYVAWILNYVIGLPYEIMLIQVFAAEVILVTIGIGIFNYMGEYLP